MITLHGADQDIALINVRSGEKEKYSWDDMMEAIGLLMEGDTPEESWAKTYGENSSVAPVPTRSEVKSNESGRTETGKPGRGKEYSGKRRAGRDEAGRGRADSRCSGRDRTGAVATRNVQRRRDFVEGTGGKENEFREELPKKDAEYRVPIGSNLLKDIRSGPALSDPADERSVLR